MQPGTKNTLATTLANNEKSITVNARQICVYTKYCSLKVLKIHQYGNFDSCNHYVNDKLRTSLAE